MLLPHPANDRHRRWNLLTKRMGLSSNGLDPGGACHSLSWIPVCLYTTILLEHEINSPEMIQTRRNAVLSPADVSAAVLRVILWHDSTLVLF